MKTYIGTKIINAKPMTRGDYNVLRGTEFRFREAYLSRAIGSLSTWVCEP